MGYGLGNAGPIPAYLAGTLDCGDDGLCAADDGYPGADNGEGDGMDDFLVQCQALQLMLEGVGQHYLQQYLAKNPGGYCGLGGTGVKCATSVFEAS